jgi:VWFA-related protein
MRRIGAYTTMAIMLFCLSAFAQEEASQASPEKPGDIQTYRVRSGLVELRAVVTDSKGRIVENLGKEDFNLLENDNTRPIDLFSVTRVDGATEAPAPAGTPAPQLPAAPVSVRRQLQGPSPRTAVLFVDNLHIHFDKLNWLKTNLVRFIEEKLDPRDTVAIVTSDGSLGLGQQFTRDRQALRYAVEQIKLGFITRRSMFTPYLAALVVLSYNGFTPNDAVTEATKIYLYEEHLKEDRSSSLTLARAMSILQETTWRRETTLQALKDLIDQMKTVSGQRMIVIFSEGFSQAGQDGYFRDDEIRAITDRAVNSGVVIYSVDSKGLETGIDASQGADAIELANSVFQDASRQEALDGISDLAVQTGGELIQYTNDFSGAIAQAFDQNRYYYNLGFYLDPDALPPQLKDISVTVAGHPDYKIRIQRGTMPADAETAVAADSGSQPQTPQQRLARALNSPVPKTDLDVSAQMYFIRNKKDDKQVTLTVFLEGDNLHYTEEGGKHKFNIEIIYGIYDSEGKPVESKSNDIEGNLSPERLQQAVNYGYWYSRRLDLKPGVYQARIGVREKDTGRMGTTSAWVEVPDIKKSRFMLSSLILLDPAPAETKSGDINAGDLKRVRTIQGVRLYEPDEACGYFFNLYPGQKKSDESSLKIKMELKKGAKAVLSHDWKELSVSKKDLKQKDGLYVGEKLNLAGLPPGVYELLVSVKDKKQTMQRSVILGIE